MFTAKQFRQKAAESAESLKYTDVPSEIRKLERESKLSALAENEDWLATNLDKGHPLAEYSDRRGGR